MILTRTPLRLSLFGGGSDYPAWFLEHEPGAVLGLAIDRYVYMGVKHMPPGQLGADGAPLRYRVQYSHVDDCQRADDIQHPAVRAMLRYLPSEEPLEFHMFADLPGRSGLGGSSACAVGLLHAMLSRRGRVSSALDLAREAIAFEIACIGEAVGFQDQLFAALGGVRFMRFAAAGSSVNEAVALSAARRRELEAALLLVYSGNMRDAHAMAAKQIERTAANAQHLRHLAELASVAHYALSAEHVPLERLGEMLHASWERKRALHPEISSLAIDALYDRGRRAGALGGKLLGAGGGGFMAFWVPPAEHERFAAEIGCEVTRIKIADRGSTIIINDEERAP